MRGLGQTVGAAQAATCSLGVNLLVSTVLDRPVSWTVPCGAITIKGKRSPLVRFIQEGDAILNGQEELEAISLDPDKAVLLVKASGALIFRIDY